MTGFNDHGHSSDKEVEQITLTLHRHHDAWTEKAYGYSEDGERKNMFWLPRSQITIAPHSDKEFEPIEDVTMPEWLANKQGLI